MFKVLSDVRSRGQGVERLFQGHIQVHRPSGFSWATIKRLMDGFSRLLGQFLWGHEGIVQGCMVHRVGGVEVRLVDGLPVSPLQHMSGPVSSDAQQGDAGMKGFSQCWTMVDCRRSRGRYYRYRAPCGQCESQGMVGCCPFIEGHADLDRGVVMQCQYNGGIS